MFGNVMVAVAARAVIATPFAVAKNGVTTLQITENEWGIAGVPATVT